jgi:hypothetical protein
LCAIKIWSCLLPAGPLPNNRLKLTEPRVTPLAEKRKRRATRPAA